MALFLFHVYEYFEYAILLDRLHSSVATMHWDIPLPDTILRGSIFFTWEFGSVSPCVFDLLVTSETLGLTFTLL